MMSKKEKLLQKEKEKVEALQCQLRILREEIQNHDRPPLGNILGIKLREFGPWIQEIEELGESIDRTLNEMHSPWAEEWRERLKKPIAEAHAARTKAITYILRKPGWFQRFKEQFEAPEPSIRHHQIETQKFVRRASA
jgi:hypothetical protein